MSGGPGSTSLGVEDPEVPASEGNPETPAWEEEPEAPAW